MVKRVLNYVIWGITLSAIAVLYGFSRVQYLNSPVSMLELSITGQQQGSFLDYNQTYTQLITTLNIDQMPAVKALEVPAIKDQLSKNPYICRADVYTTLDGKIRVLLTEYQALLRVFTSAQQNFYIDHLGTLFPISEYHSERVMIANGAIPAIPFFEHQKITVYDKLLEENPIKDVYLLAIRLTNDSFLNLMIDQLFVRSNGEIELIPKIGHAGILIGDDKQIDKKLENVTHFFKEKAGSDELQHYSLINAKYINQIICTKK